MRLTVKRALENDLVTVIEQNRSAGKYRVRIGILKTPVTIELKPYSGRRTQFLTSHRIQTPKQMSPYAPSRNICTSRGSALYEAINSLTGFYKSPSGKFRFMMRR